MNLQMNDFRDELDVLRGMRNEMTRFMEEMRRDREDRNWRNDGEANVGNQNRNEGRFRAEHRNEGHEEAEWNDDEYDEAYDYGNYHYGGRGHRPLGVEGLGEEGVAEILGLELIKLKPIFDTSYLPLELYDIKSEHVKLGN
ncbi:hypothetical protein GH714_027469 [Hevea brasiliensis]|uniref:Uncharacterized protein n=1 Tax=Hevea brasiliensis TaxID=3981 RepID=A0A6A6KF27_HEVBR|nr:hypothetical protein GH714_027469 [Hevea brasiliensis]